MTIILIFKAYYFVHTISNMKPESWLIQEGMRQKLCSSLWDNS